MSLLLDVKHFVETSGRRSLAIQQEIDSLVKTIKASNKEYHSGTGKKVKLTDKQYDAARDRLAEIDPRNPILKQVGAVLAPAAKRKEVTLPTFMGSLDKIYIDKTKDVLAWIKRYLTTGSAIITDKMDGISALLENRGGTLMMFTRGNGSVGSDISQLIPHLKNIPRLKLGQIVRGEIVVSKAIFNKMFSKAKLGEKDGYDNPRALAAGIGNRIKTVHEAAKHGEFIIHEMVKPAAPLSKVAAMLEKLGGKIVNYVVIRGVPTVARIAAILEKTVKASKYDVDGIVIDNGKGAKIAIKQENESAAATVKQVRWQVGKNLYLTPVADFVNPVRVSGVSITKATVHNASLVKEWGIGPGAIVNVLRSGEVIPKIIGVITKAKPSFPPKGTYEWDGKEIISTKESDTDIANVKKLSSFLSVLTVKGFKDNLLSILYEAGIDNPTKLVKAPVSRLVAAGLSDLMAKKLKTAITTQLAVATMPQMMVASNIFPSGFGRTASKKIWTALGQKSLDLTSAKLRPLLEDIDGLGEKLIDSFIAGRPNFLTFLAATGWQPPKVSKAGSKLKGVVFLFTGFRDSKLQAFLEHNGAEMAGSMSRKVNYLIVKDLSYSNDKVEKAKEWKIKRITADQARQLPTTYKGAK